MTLTDDVLQQITSYAAGNQVFSENATKTAKYALLDTIGCAFAALSYPACTKLIGPIVQGTYVPNGARVPGTSYVLDPVRAAFSFGAALRWLDYNDTWLAAEWGHPSDNLGAILPLTDWLARSNAKGEVLIPTMRDVLDALIRAYEIQGILSLTNSLNRHGFDHVLFTKVASSAVCARLLGANEEEILSAASNAFLDVTLRTYRHAPNTGSRKSWAAADATSRGLMFALMAIQGEMGYKTALTAPVWGVEDVLFGGNKVTLARPLCSYVMEHILFKVSYPAEFHAQTALEAAIQLHPEVVNRLAEIDKVTIHTHESALRIIDKHGPLHNPADRDHCIQYIVAIGLLKGNLTSNDYEDEAAADERIDWLRNRMDIFEDRRFSEEYLDAEKRSAASSVTVHFLNGEVRGPVTVEYPLGHPVRRNEALPKLKDKFTENIMPVLGQSRTEHLVSRLWSTNDWLGLQVNQFVDLFLK